MTIEYQGKGYHRQPGRRYFAGVRGALLHRVVWEAERGPIPPGWEVHHVDRDPANNAIENLRCLSPADHAAEHADERRERGRQPDLLAHLDAVRPLSSAWHRSDEGRRWHSENARAAWEQREPEARTCQRCGGTYSTRDRTLTLYCSNRCKAAARRASGVDDVDRVCDHCGNTYRIGRYTTGRTCTRSCAAKMRWAAAQVR